MIRPEVRHEGNTGWWLEGGVVTAKGFHNYSNFHWLITCFQPLHLFYLWSHHENYNLLQKETGCNLQGNASGFWVNVEAVSTSSSPKLRDITNG